MLSTGLKDDSLQWPRTSLTHFPSDYNMAWYTMESYMQMCDACDYLTLQVATTGNSRDYYVTLWELRDYL